MSKGKLFQRTALYVGIFLFPFFILLLNAKILMNEESFYNHQYTINGAYERFGKETAMNETQRILNFYQKGTPIQSEFFNEKEMAHLSDVRTLYQKANMVFYGILLIAALAFIFLDKQGKGKMLLYGALLTLGIIAIVYLLAIIDFSSSFTLFHELVFSNNNWMLDPAADNLIVLSPESFFIAFVMTNIKRTAILAFVLLLVGYSLIKIKRTKISPQDSKL